MQYYRGNHLAGAAGGVKRGAQQAPTQEARSRGL